MEKKTEEVSEYYDGFSSYQLAKGINSRHLSIFRFLRKAGLKKNSIVLEIGCGIGTVTHLISNHCKSGFVLGVDISRKSIELAMQAHKGKGWVEFMVSDMKDFSYERKFDFIVLPDVLEHIPVEDHTALFKTLGRHSNADTTILIHIPNPPYLRNVIRQRQELLQVIDQPLDTSELLNATAAADFRVHRLWSYSLFSKHEDYQCIILKKGRYFEFMEDLHKTKFSIVLRKLVLRFSK